MLLFLSCMFSRSAEYKSVPYFMSAQFLKPVLPVLETFDMGTLIICIFTDQIIFKYILTRSTVKWTNLSIYLPCD